VLLLACGGAPCSIGGGLLVEGTPCPRRGGGLGASRCRSCCWDTACQPLSTARTLFWEGLHEHTSPHGRSGDAARSQEVESGDAGCWVTRQGCLCVVYAGECQPPFIARQDCRHGDRSLSNSRETHSKLAALLALLTCLDQHNRVPTAVSLLMMHYLGPVCHYLGAVCHYLGAICHYLGAVCHYLGAVCHYIVCQKKRMVSAPLHNSVTALLPRSCSPCLSCCCCQRPRDSQAGCCPIRAVD
jgi:hypothetical protein